MKCRAAGCEKPPYGHRKDLCERHYKFMRKYGSFEPPPNITKPATARCCVAGCTSPPRGRIATYCEKHYGQLRRNGYLGPIKRPRLIDNSAGYKLLEAPDHRLTTPGQTYRVYEHRAEFYEQFGEGPFFCTLCGKQIEWDTARICRYNSDKADNEIDNLVAACHSCASKLSYDAARPILEKIHFRYIEWNGQRKLLKEWAEHLGVTASAIGRRLKRWPVDKALSLRGRSLVLKPPRRKLTTEQVSEIRSMVGHFPDAEIARAFNVSRQTIARIRLSEHSSRHQSFSTT